MKFKNRLAELRGDMSQEKFAQMIGLTQQNYWKYENGVQGLRSDLIEKICSTFGCSAEWLLCLDLKPMAIRGFSAVPLLGRIAAGEPIQMDEVDDTREAPTKYKVDDESVFLLRVEGDSVNRIIRDGDFALVSPKYREPNEHDLFAVCINGHDATIKHVKKLANGFMLIPDSHDPTYRPQIFDYNDENTSEITIIGKVVWACMAY